MDEPTCFDAPCGSPVYALGRCKRQQSAEPDDLNSVRGTPVEERFWSWVDRRKPEECWPWKGFADERGRCRFYVNRSYPSIYVHRMAYILAVGPIPAGLQIDHMCHRPEECPGGGTCPHRRCCNPAHLEPATNRVNTLRGGNACAVNARRTYCKNGHEFTPENTYITKKGHRVCRACRNRCARNLIERRWKQGLRADGKARQTQVIRYMVREAMEEAGDSDPADPG